MLIKRIYRAAKGEGKTKWLVENAIDSAVIAGTNHEESMLFYLGAEQKYQNFKAMYEEMMHTKCPIGRWDHDDMRGCDTAILFTDELMADINFIPYHLPESGIWFITMDTSDFVQ